MINKNIYCYECKKETEHWDFSDLTPTFICIICNSTNNEDKETLDTRLKNISVEEYTGEHGLPGS